MKGKIALAVSTIVLVLATVPRPVVAAGVDAIELHIQKGRLSVNGALVLPNVAVASSNFGYLFLYVPHRGLFTISAKPFEGAAEAGRFDGATLEFSAGGAKVRLAATSNILDRDVRAWVKLDRGYHLPELERPAVAVGGDPRKPGPWVDEDGH